MAYHEKTGWLLVAEAGINARGGDRSAPGGACWGTCRAAGFRRAWRWMGDTVFVANAKGNGTGPNAFRRLGGHGF